MRFLIVAAVLACANAAPSGVLAPYGLGLGHGLVGHGAPLAVAHAAPLALAHAAVPVVAAPTISPGDIQGAQIEAHVDASDHARAYVDAAREQHDQVSELHGQAVNAAEDHAWAAVDAAKTHEAQLDGAAAGAAPIIAKQLAYSAPAVGYAAPAIGYAGHAVAGPALGYAAQGYAAPGLGYAAPGLGYAAQGLGYAGHGLAASKTVVHQSLSQSHPAPLVHAAPLAHGYAAPLAHGYGAPLAGGYAHGW